MSEAELQRFPQHRFGQAFTTLKCDCPPYLLWLEKRWVLLQAGHAEGNPGRETGGKTGSSRALNLNKTVKRLFLIAENATSSCLGRSTENKYPTFLKCERPHLCNVHFLPVCLYSGAWSVSDPGHRANIATGAVLSQTDLEGTSGT